MTPIFSSNILRRQSAAFYLLTLGFGLTCFFCIAPFSILLPTNLAWIGPYDPTMHYLGWAVFQNSPWSWPLGLNPDYGLQISSSIVYSDAIPLFAFAFKALKNYLPTPFQYFGVWYLVCLLLQCAFAFVLIERILAKHLPLVVRLLLVSLFAFAPILLWRIGEHAALSAHFVLLAALALALARDRVGAWLWLLLLALTALINSYLLLMVLALWAASLLDTSFPVTQKHLPPKQGTKTYRAILLQVVLAGAALFATLWVAGYFVLSGGASTGSFGIGRMNVLAIFNARGWSYILGQLPERAISSAQGDAILSMMEGYNYFGLGIICLIPLALWGLPKVWSELKPALLHHRFLVLSLMGLTILAISNNVSVGPWNLQIPLPQKIYDLASIVRASGRMFWPVWYALVLLMIWIISCAYSKKVASIILVLACVIQIVDTSAGWLPLRQRLSTPPSSASPWLGFLKSPFWADAAKRYKAVEVIPLAPGQGQLHWQTLGAYAAQNHLKTNAVFLARVDTQKVTSANQATYLHMRQGKYDPNTLYILGNEMVIPVLMHLKNSDLLARIDGMNVLAPGWRTCQECVKVDKGEWVDSKISKDNQSFFVFNRSHATAITFLLPNGWGNPEEWGAWSEDYFSTITLPAGMITPDSKILFTAKALVVPSHPKQDFIVSINGKRFEKISLNNWNGNSFSLPLSGIDFSGGVIVIDMQFLTPARPSDLGITPDDNRLLAIGIESIEIK